MSNKINTTTGNEVKDMNTTELEGKASSSTSQSGGMSNAAKLLVIAIGNFVTMGLLIIGYAVLMNGETVYTADKVEGAVKESILMTIAAIVAAVALYIILSVFVNKGKKESEASTEEQSAEVVKTEEVTGAEDKKPSNPFSNAVKFLMLGLSVIIITAFMGYVFALLR